MLYEFINATKHKLFCSQRVAKTLCGAIMLQRVSRVKIRGEGGLEAQSQVKRRQTLIWTPMIALESADFLILLLHASWRSIFILILWSPDDISLRMWMLFLSTYRVVNWVHPYLDYTLRDYSRLDYSWLDKRHLDYLWCFDYRRLDYFGPQGRFDYKDIWTIAVWTTKTNRLKIFRMLGLTEISY